MRFPVLMLLVLSGFGTNSLPVVGQEEETDSIQAELEVRREECKTSKAKAAESLVIAIDSAIAKVEVDTELDLEEQLKQLDDLHAERKAFLEQGVLPKSKQLKSGLDSFAAELRKADLSLFNAIGEAMQKYRTTKDFEAVRKLLTEQKSLKERIESKKPTADVAPLKQQETIARKRENLTRFLTGKRISFEPPHSLSFRDDGMAVYSNTGVQIIWTAIDSERVLLVWPDSNHCDMLIFSADRKSFTKRWLGNQGNNVDFSGEVLSK